MKTVLVCKAGSVFRTRSCPGNVAGEQGETEGIIRHLVDRGDVNVVYFGRYEGERLCEVIEPHISSFDEYTTAREQEAAWARDLVELRHYEPIAFIQTAGYSPTFSWVRNPNSATVQAAAVRYTGPMHNACQGLGIPRIVINNDPRTYPRDQEMSYGWDWVRPAAILSQEERRWTQVVGGKRYKCHAVFSRAESWAYHNYRENQDLDLCVVIAHNHFRYGIKNRDDAYVSAWRDVLSGELPPNTHVYGKGWEPDPSRCPRCGCLGHDSATHDWYCSECGRKWNEEDALIQGCASPEDVLDLFNMHTCGPVVSHTPGFYTGKPYVMMSQGCIPLLHESYDPRGLFGDVSRIHKPGDLLRLAYQLTDVSQRAEARSHWREVLKPDWTMLDRLIDQLPNTEGFGGYVSS